MKTSGIKLMAVGFAAVFLSACSSVVAPPTTFGIRHFVASSGGDRPVWIDNTQEFQAKHQDRMYFVGIATKERDYTLARSNAYADALKNMARGIKATVHDLYTSASTEDKSSASDYSQDTERAIEDGTLQTALGVITGAEVDQYYWRKYWVQPDAGAPVIYYRNVYALVSLSKADYEKTVYQTLSAKEKRVQDPRARQVIREMKNRWLTKPAASGGTGGN